MTRVEARSTVKVILLCLTTVPAVGTSRTLSSRNPARLAYYPSGKLTPSSSEKEPGSIRPLTRYSFSPSLRIHCTGFSCASYSSDISSTISSTISSSVTIPSAPPNSSTTTDGHDLPEHPDQRSDQRHCNPAAILAKKLKHQRRCHGGVGDHRNIGTHQRGREQPLGLVEHLSARRAPRDPLAAAWRSLTRSALTTPISEPENLCMPCSPQFLHHLGERQF